MNEKIKHYPVNVKAEESSKVTSRSSDGKDIEHSYYPISLEGLYDSLGKIHDGYSGEPKIGDLAIPFKMNEGDEYFYVYVVHGDGDSYNTIRGLVRPIDVFSTYEKAKNCATAIVEHNDFGDRFKNITKPPGFDDSRVSYQDELGNTKTVSVSWMSWCEHLDEVKVAKIPFSLSHGKRFSFK